MKQIIFALVFVSLLSSTAFAQEINFGKPAVQTVVVTIDEQGNAHITHTVEKNTSSQQLTLLRNDFTNLVVTDEKGNPAEYAETGGDKASLLIFPSKTKILVEYDLEKVVTEKNGFWKWDYMYLASTSFLLPNSTDVVFVNANPILLKDIDGIRCHGCQVKLEYGTKSLEQTQKITWEGKTFDVKTSTNGKISELKLDQSNKMLSFEVMEKDQYVTLIIPKELLWNPYEVFLNDKKVPKHEFYQTEDMVWLNFKANNTGKVDIIGVSVVPEFPLAAVLVLGAAMIMVARLSGRLNLH